MTTGHPLAAAGDAELLAALRGSLADAPETDLLRLAELFAPADPMPASVVESCRDLASLARSVEIAERPPSGCHWCGIGQRDHYSRYAEPTGWHRYTVPSQERVKARMLARRRHALTRRAVS